jgi:hypothetical protein
MVLLASGIDPDAKRASSVESEEDPCLQPEPSPCRVEFQGVSEVESQEDDGALEGHLAKKRKLNRKFEVRDPDDEDEDVEMASASSSSSEGEEENISLYSVQETTNIDGKEAVQLEIGRFPSIKDANSALKKQAAKYRKRQWMHSVTEHTDSDGFLSCTLFYDGNGLHQQTAWVEEMFPESNNDSGAVLAPQKKRLFPQQIYVVRRRISTNEVDQATGEARVLDKTTKYGSFTSRKMANQVACDSLCAYIKPQTPNMNHVSVWNDHCKEIKEMKEQWDNNNELFDAEIDTSDEESWMDADGVSFVVEMKWR